MGIKSWTKWVENNGEKIILHPLRLYEERREDGGLLRIESDGEIWTESYRSMGEWCQFAGMKSGYWDSAIPIEFVKEYYGTHLVAPCGIWSYEPEFNGNKIFGDFVSLDAITNIVQGIVKKKLMDQKTV